MAASLKKSFTNASLSGRTFVMRPHYKKKAPPQELEWQDHVFDPALDKKTLPPEKVGTIRRRKEFNRQAHGMMNVWTIVKRPQSDVYHVPVELKQWKEFIQKAIDEEHNRTPAAFTRAATFFVRQGTGTPGKWHYDVRPEETVTSWHYLASDRNPTQHAILKLRRNVKADGTFRPLFEATPLKDLTFKQAAAKKKQRLVSADRLKTHAAKPYEIMRQGPLTLHRGTASADSRGRTFVSLSFHDLDAGDYRLYPSRGMKRFRRTESAPADISPLLLERYLKRQRKRPKP